MAGQTEPDHTEFDRLDHSSLAKQIFDDVNFLIPDDHELEDTSEEKRNTSEFEIAETIVEDLKSSYGIEYTMKGDTYLLNKEIYAFLKMPREEQQEIWQGRLTHHRDGPFVFFMDLLKKLKAIRQKEMDRPDILIEEWNILKRRNMFDFFLYWIFQLKPISKLVKQNRVLFAKLNLTTRESINDQISKTNEKIVSKWKSGQAAVRHEELPRRRRAKRSARK